MLTKTPAPPYVAVIFTSKRTPGDDGYGAMAEEMERMVRQQPGFIGLDSARDENGIGITVGYFVDDAAVRAWKQVPEHQNAQQQGRARWYEQYEVRVAKVERAYAFHSAKQNGA